MNQESGTGYDFYALVMFIFAFQLQYLIRTNVYITQIFLLPSNIDDRLCRRRGGSGHCECQLAFTARKKVVLLDEDSEGRERSGGSVSICWRWLMML